jgi:hypothetical protein
METVLIFITGPSRAKLGRTNQQQLLTLTSLESHFSFKYRWGLLNLA